MDLGLYQRQVAEIIGVSESTVWHWERGIEPELRYMPKIIEFLGYSPFTCPADLLGPLRHYKLVNGLSHIRLGKLMSRDPEQRRIGSPDENVRAKRTSRRLSRF
jgi:transcriptional regulator with XRE-family HTH domain